MALKDAVGFSMVLVPGCTASVAAWGALLLVRLSNWVVIVAKAVVKYPRVFLTSFKVELSS